MKAWLIYRIEDAERNQSFIDWFLSEARNLNIQLELIYHHEISYGVKNSKLSIHRNKETALPDFVIMRAIDVLLSKQLEHLGVRVYNNSTVAEIANDKAKTYQLFAAHGIDMVDTEFVTTDALLKKDYHFPLIMKEVRGRGGSEVYKVDSKDKLIEFAKVLPGKQYVVQSLAIAGKDLRVYVVGRDIIKAVLRESDNDFRSNYTLGGNIQLYDLTGTEEKLIYKIIDILPVDMAGIDFVFNGDNQLLLNEIEDVVGCRSLTSLTNINIVRIYLQYILRDLSNES